MDIKIINFKPKYFKEMAISFAQSFPDWDIERCDKYIRQAYKTCPDYCFAAIDNKQKILGAIFCKSSPYNKSEMLIIELLQIKKEHQKRTVGTLLLKEVIEKARKNNVAHIGMLAFDKKKFPLNWFKRIGFKETGWIELAAKTKKLKA